jgi:hypothetical protein
MRRHRPWSDLDRRHDTQTSPQGWQAQHPQALVATPWVKQTASKTLNACNTTNTVQMAICNTTNTVQMAISSAGSSRARWPVWCLPQAVCTWTRLLHHRIGQAGTVPSRSHWRPRLPPMGRHQRLANLCRLFARPKRLGRTPAHLLLICGTTQLIFPFRISTADMRHNPTGLFSPFGSQRVDLVVWRHEGDICHPPSALCHSAAQCCNGGPLRPPRLSREPSHPRCGWAYAVGKIRGRPLEGYGSA